MNAIEKLLLKVEQSVHRGGWDQEPFLGFLVQPRPGKVGLAEIPVGIQNPPADFLQWFADRLGQTPELTRDLVDGYPGLQGIAFVCEAWESPRGMTHEQLTEAAERGLHIADMVGALEIRTVYAVTLAGQVLAVKRVRGEKPTCHSFEWQFGGRVPAALTTILGHVAPYVPDGDAYAQILHDLLEQMPMQNGQP